MAISNDTANKLSDAIIDDVAQYVTEDPRFVDLLGELVTDAIQQKLGDIDRNLLIKLTQRVSSKLMCAANYSEVFYPRCPINP
tara:strand:+ start:397 stop:645 length:249 start_codon:yes stop_codon:yes gene_type:complete